MNSEKLVSNEINGSVTRQNNDSLEVGNISSETSEKTLSAIEPVDLSRFFGDIREIAQTSNERNESVFNLIVKNYKPNDKVFHNYLNEVIFPYLKGIKYLSKKRLVYLDLEWLIENFGPEVALLFGNIKVESQEELESLDSLNLSGLSVLEVSGELDSKGVNLLADSPTFSRLTFLKLYNNSIDDDDMLVLINSINFKNLSTLEIYHNPITCNSAEAIANSSNLTSLNSFSALFVHNNFRRGEKSLRNSEHFKLKDLTI